MKTRPVATVILVLLLAGAVVAWVGAGRFWPNHSLGDVIDAPRTGDQASVPGAPGMALGLPPVREPEGGKAGPVGGSGAPPQVAGASSAPTAERPVAGLPLPVPGPAKPDVAAPSSMPGAPSGNASGGVADRPAESGGLVAGQAGGTLPSSAPAQGAPAQGAPAQGGASQGGATQGGGAQGGAASGGPRFDVVRVGPQGTAIIAGRAAPGSDVVVKDGDTEVARARADAQGAFVALPSEPLRPGGRELTLASRSAGGVETKGDGSVVMVVPPPPAGPAPAPAGAAQAILVPDSASPRVLQGPGPDAGQGGAQSPAGAGRQSVAVALDRVDYDEKGAIRFTGGAAPGAAVRLYVDNVAVGDTRAGDDGRWSLTPAGVVTPGVHSLRVDAVDGRGVVTSRVELPFQRDTQRPAAVAGAGEQAVPQVGGQVGVQVVVQPGQSLWRLARVAYGRGVQYSVIYLANRDQIRDPRLIYPGQTFSVPPERP